MKLWINNIVKNLSGNPVIAVVLIGFSVLFCFTDLSAQTDTLRFRSTEPVEVQPPIVITTIDTFEKGNWYHIYLQDQQVRFQNAVSDTTIAFTDLEKYLDAHLPGENPKLAMYLSTDNYKQDYETMRFIAERWKCFSFRVVTPSSGTK